MNRSYNQSLVFILRRILLIFQSWEGLFSKTWNLSKGFESCKINTNSVRCNFRDGSSKITKLRQLWRLSFLPLIWNFEIGKPFQFDYFDKSYSAIQTTEQDRPSGQRQSSTAVVRTFCYLKQETSLIPLFSFLRQSKKTRRWEFNYLIAS